MPTFLARVELKGSPSEETYDRLHSVLADYNFFQQSAQGLGSGADDLPHATYINTAAPPQDILGFYGSVRDTLVTQGFTFKLTLAEVSALHTTEGTKWEGKDSK